MRCISALLIGAGLLLLADAVLTLVWQEPVSAAIALIERSRVDRHWLSYRTAPLAASERRRADAMVSGPQRIAYLATREQREAHPGDALGRMTLPSLGLSYLIVQGTSPASLETGPGHYPSTALPGQGRTVAVAGHRTTFLAPFRHLDALRPGQRIVMVMPYARFVYVVQYRRVVAPTAWSITRNVGYDRLVLSACAPLFSAARRLVVFARLRSAV
jgi:sortase A